MVAHFYVGHSNIIGTLHPVMLPRNIKILDLSSNNFSGTVDWEDLPLNIERLYLYNNQFEGNVNLDVLPSNLKWLFVGNNKFSSVSGMKREGLHIDEIDELHKI